MNDELKNSNSIEELLDDEVNTNDEQNQAEEDIEIDIGNQAEYISLNSGNALTLEDIYPLSAAYDTKIIYFIGPVGSGKTTIQTTLYQLFLNGGLENYFFAGSNTLNAFEQRAFLTRISSNNNTAETPRTPVDLQEIFLHLKLYNTKKDCYTNYLLADLSGEAFENSIGDTGEMNNRFPHLKYADFIVGVLDGEILMDKRKRLGAIQDLKTFLQTIYDAGLFKTTTKFQVAISKYDVIDDGTTNDDPNNDITTFIADQKTSILKHFQNRFDLEFYEVAAMPKNTSHYHVGSGLKDMMISWNNSVPKPKPQKLNIKSEMNRLNYKLLGENYE